MPRVSLLVLTLIAAALFTAQVRSGGEAATVAAHRALDRQLERADKETRAAADSLSRDSLAVAQAVARSEALQASLGERVARGEMPDGTALDAAAGALAERPVSEGRSTLLVLVTDRGFAESRLGEAARSGEGPRVTAAAEALAGKPTAGIALVDDRLYRVAAVPVGAGQKPLGALVLGFPVDDAYATRLSQAAGVEVSVVRSGKVVASTLAPAERAQVGAEAARNGMLPFGFGTVPADSVRLLGMPLPWLSRGASAERAASQPVPGVEDALLVLSLDELPSLTFGLDMQRRGIFSAAAVLLLGLVLLPLSRGKRTAAASSAGPPQVEPILEPPTEVVSALPPEPAFGPPEPVDELGEPAHTDPFGRGGSVRPVEKTLVAKVSEGSRPPLEHTQPRPAETAWPDAFAGLPGSPQAEPPTVIASGMIMGDPFAGLPSVPGSGTPLEATRVAEPRAQAALLDAFAVPSRMGAESPAAYGVTPEQTVVAMVPQALLKATSRPADADPETVHFKEVFREFLEVRRHCGEPVDGITFDRFVVKLRKNRDQLVEKYRCKGVRFTVYVKDGKTALKAVPVRE